MFKILLVVGALIALSAEEVSAATQQQWGRVRAVIAVELAAARQCERLPSTCTTATKQFNAMVAELRKVRGRARASKANNLANAAVRETTDQTLHGMTEVWSSPLETLARGRGDCEDYAILKYALLLQAGEPRTSLRIVIGWFVNGKKTEGHAVLEARTGSGTFFLDNKHSSLRTMHGLVPRRNLIAYYS